MCKRLWAAWSIWSIYSCSFNACLRCVTLLDVLYVSFWLNWCVLLVKHLEFQDSDSLGISTLGGLLNGLVHDLIKHITVSTVLYICLHVHVQSCLAWFAWCIRLLSMATHCCHVVCMADGILSYPYRNVCRSTEQALWRLHVHNSTTYISDDVRDSDWLFVCCRNASRQTLILLIALSAKAHCMSM